MEEVSELRRPLSQLAGIVHIAGNLCRGPEGDALSFLAFVRYSLGSVLRNGKRSLYALIGIAIALSLISGSWIAVDSSGIGLLRAALDRVPVDYVGTSVFTSSEVSNDAVRLTESTVAQIESVVSIEAATPIISVSRVSSAYYMNSSGGVYIDESGQNFSGNLVFLSNSSQRLLDSFKIVGSLPDPGTVAIPKDVADSLGLKIGDDITCVFEREQYYWVKGSEGPEQSVNITYFNITSSISNIWTQPGFESPNQDWFGTPMVDKGDSDIWLRQASNPVVFNLADYERLGIDRSGSDLPYSVGWSYFVWVDRGEVIKLANLPAAVDRLRLIQDQLAKKPYPNVVHFDDSDLIPSLESLDYDLKGKEPLFLALSVPVLALGVYLSMVGVDLGVTERRREAGILKSRGASNKQVFGSLIVEAIALGAISGIAGLLLGAFVSRFLLGAVASFGGEAVTEVTDFLASSTTVILCILTGIALMLFSSYGPFKRVSKTDVAQALHHYSPTATQLEYSPMTDIALLLLSLWSVVTIFLGFDWPGRQGLSWIVEVVLDTSFIFGIAILPLLPFMLSLSLVRLLTRGSRRLYSKFAWLVKPWTKDLHYLIDRNIVRNPRRASNLCVIISLALAFGLFISVTMESTMNYEREQVHFEVGSDIKLDASFPGPVTQSVIDESKLEGLAALPGVEHAVTYSQLDLIFDDSGYLYDASSVVLNSTDYLETVKPSDFYFIDGGNELLKGLSSDGTVLLSKDFADQIGLQVGRILPVVVQSYSRYNRIDVTVTGLVKGLPGFSGVDAFIDRHTLSVVSEENLTGVYYNNGAFIAVVGGANPHEVADAAVELYERANLTCSSTILQDRLDALNRDPTFASLADFLYMEYALSIVIMTIGVGLLIFVAVHDREKELACIMARGASGGQVRKILMGESMSLMILGLVVGASVGILTAYLFNTLSGEELYATVERKMVFTFVSFSIVLSSIVALILASLLATARAGKIKLAEVLRIRGG
jgi:ABC-type lipoprotein release transport system permease subunit